MNALRWVLFAGLLVLAAVSVGSYALSCRQGAVKGVAEQQAAYYCPMHPTYTSDRPGECPICGMNLEPVPASNGGGFPEHGGDVPGLASVELAPERIQMIGVRTARVERRPVGGSLELVGFLAPDEAAIKRVQIRVSGWVEGLPAGRTGETVEAGQPLLTLYSPELYQSEMEFLIELGAHDSAGAHHQDTAVAAARDRLRLLGVPQEEIERLERERKASSRLTLRSPVGGTVLERGVVEGQYVSAETPLFTVAELSRVWVLADLYEMDFGRVQVGDPARFSADALPGRRFETRVDFVYPTVSPETRTVKVRFALPNRERLLRPGMYGRVTVRGRSAPGLVVPGEAVVRTGEETYVFLARSGGRFEPRRVALGLQDGDWIQILGGLAEGDTVVSSASFLIDSESRLKAAISGMGEPSPSAGHRH